MTANWRNRNQVIRGQAYSGQPSTISITCKHSREQDRATKTERTDYEGTNMTLSTDKQQLIEQRIANDSKNIFVAYLLWFFVGMFGGHRFYLGESKSAIIMLVLTILGFVSAILIVGYFILLGVCIWVLVDAFLIPGKITTQKNIMRQQLTAEMSA
ncbi:TM2 domain-containing protein [Ruegeria meonggei]|nr:TM2 domain-containing protein [Ruegeria meonggei]